MNKQRRQIISKNNTSSNGLNLYNLCIRSQHLKKKVCNHLTCPGNTYFEYSSFLSDNNKLCLVSFCLFHKLSNNSNLPKWIIATFSNSPMNLFPEKKGIFVIPSTSSSRSCIIVALSSVTIHQYFFSGQPSHQLSEKLHFFSCCSYC